MDDRVPLVVEVDDLVPQGVIDQTPSVGFGVDGKPACRQAARRLSSEPLSRAQCAVRPEEAGVGTWGTGPFDNDTAADFSDLLDDTASPGKRGELVRGVLTRTVAATGYLAEAEEAVAAAALIAAQCPGGEQVSIHYGPRHPLPNFPQDLRELAAQALDRVLADELGLSGAWVDPADAHHWISSLKILRDVLDPPPASLDVPLPGL